MSALRIQVHALVSEFLAEEIVDLIDPPDPFNLDNSCPGNPAGHRFINSCGDIVCPHCEKVVWQ